MMIGKWNYSFNIFSNQILIVIRFPLSFYFIYIGRVLKIEQRKKSAHAA